MTRLLACALATVLAGGAAAGCGRAGADPMATLRDTAARFDDVRSGRLDLRLALTSPAAASPIGVRIAGPFALPEDRGTMLADFTLTRLGTPTPPLRVVSAPDGVFVVVAGRVRDLPGGGARFAAAGRGGRELRVDRWLRDPVRADGGAVNGADTVRVEAMLDVRAALADVAPLTSVLRELDPRERDRLAAVVRDARISVWSGADDSLPRRLVLTGRLDAADAAVVPAALRRLLPVTFELRLDLAGVNEPVRIVAPR